MRLMLTDGQLIVEVRKLAAKSQRLATLLLLAHLQQPAQTGLITNKGVDIGFRAISKWNISDILAAAAAVNLVTKRPQGWELLDPGRDAIRSAGVDLGAKRTVAPSDSVLPRELFVNTRGYIEKVVKQINGSYDHEFYDCCAVMCRRLAETLIIEVYETAGRAALIKGADGHFLMLNGLLNALFKDAKFNLGRNSIRGLEALKGLGDKSAHSRMFNALQPDVNNLRSDFRAAMEELLHLAKLIR